MQFDEWRRLLTLCLSVLVVSHQSSVSAQANRQVILPQPAPSAQDTLSTSSYRATVEVPNELADMEEKERGLYLRWLQPSTTFVPGDGTAYIAADAGVSYAPFHPGLDLRQPLDPQTIMTTQGKTRLATGGLGLPIVQRLVPAEEAETQLMRRRFGTFPKTVSLIHPDGHEDKDTAPLVHMGNRSSATLRLSVKGTYRLVMEEKFTQPRWINHLSQNPDIILATQNTRAEPENPPPAPLDLSVMAIAAGTDAERESSKQSAEKLATLVAAYKDQFTAIESEAAEFLLSTNLHDSSKVSPEIVESFIASVRERLIQDTFITPAKEWIDPTLTDAQIGHLKVRHHNRIEAFISKEIRNAENLAPAKHGLDWLAGNHPNFLWEDEVAQMQLSLQGKIAPQGVRVRVIPYRFRHFYDPADAFELRTDPRGVVFIDWPESGWFLIEAAIDRTVQVGDYDVNRFQLWLAVEVFPKHIRDSEIKGLRVDASTQAQKVALAVRPEDVVSPIKPISQLPKGERVIWDWGLPK